MTWNEKASAAHGMCHCLWGGPGRWVETSLKRAQLAVPGKLLSAQAAKYVAAAPSGSVSFFFGGGSGRFGYYMFSIVFNFQPYLRYFEIAWEVVEPAWKPQPEWKHRESSDRQCIWLWVDSKGSRTKLTRVCQVNVFPCLVTVDVAVGLPPADVESCILMLILIDVMTNSFLSRIVFFSRWDLSHHLVKKNHWNSGVDGHQSDLLSAAYLPRSECKECSPPLAMIGCMKVRVWGTPLTCSAINDSFWSNTWHHCTPKDI